MSFSPFSAHATLQDDINQAQAEQTKLNAELKDIRTQKASLANEVAAFDLQISIIQAQINQTQAEINKISEEVDQTNAEITKAETDLAKQKEIMKEYLRTMYIEGQTSTIELIAKSNNFSDFVDQSEYLNTMRDKVQETADKIIKLKAELETKKKDLEVKKAKAEQLKQEQIAQRQGVDSQRAAKDNLLQTTRGQESAFQKQLAAAKQKEAAAWAAYEEAIRTASGTRNSNYTGGGGSGYLIWPSAGTLTQGYGWTEFAQSGAYNGKIHNGLDISCGYPCGIKAAAGGVVLDQGYEANSGGWGNWTAIRHPNGLVTLYGHQSAFAVGVGQTVSQGQVIGYEGNTGFSTGSHLHFSVFTSFVLYNTAGYHGPAYEGTVNPYTFL